MLFSTFLFGFFTCVPSIEGRFQLAPTPPNILKSGNAFLGVYSRYLADPENAETKMEMQTAREQFSQPYNSDIFFIENTICRIEIVHPDHSITVVNMYCSKKGILCVSARNIGLASNSVNFELLIATSDGGCPTLAGSVPAFSKSLLQMGYQFAYISENDHQPLSKESEMSMRTPLYRTLFAEKIESVDDLTTYGPLGFKFVKKEQEEELMNAAEFVRNARLDDFLEMIKQDDEWWVEEVRKVDQKQLLIAYIQKLMREEPKSPQTALILVELVQSIGSAGVSKIVDGGRIMQVNLEKIYGDN